MKVFVTGASGFVGTAVVQELLTAGHQVLGLARSENSGKVVSGLGAEVLRGDIEDVECLKKGTELCDAVIHTAFIHDFSNFDRSCAVDKSAIDTIGRTLVKTPGKAFLFTSGIGLLKAGQKGKESDDADIQGHVALRAQNERLGLSFAEQGVKVGVVRLPPTVHGAGDHGFIPMLIQIAKEKGLSAYIGELKNIWSAVHKQDAAKVYRLALERGIPGSRWHAVAEEEIPFQTIAETLGAALRVPVKDVALKEAPEHFGWFSRFASMAASASSQYTQKTLEWEPTLPSLKEDLSSSGPYFC